MKFTPQGARNKPERDLKIEWTEETSWGNMIEGLTAGRYDIICSGLARSTGRTKFISFGAPIFYAPVDLVVRKDDARFDNNIGLINDPAYKIAVLEGELTSIIARQIYPKASTSAMPQMNDYGMLLKEVETGKADVTMITAETFKAYDHNNPGLLKVLKSAVTVFPTSVGLPKKDEAFRDMIDTAINEMLNDGTVDKLLKKHEEYPGTFLHITKPYMPAK